MTVPAPCKHAHTATNHCPLDGHRPATYNGVLMSDSGMRELPIAIPTKAAVLQSAAETGGDGRQQNASALAPAPVPSSGPASDAACIAASCPASTAAAGCGPACVPAADQDFNTASAPASVAPSNLVPGLAGNWGQQLGGLWDTVCKRMEMLHKGRKNYASICPKSDNPNLNCSIQARSTAVLLSAIVK